MGTAGQPKYNFIMRNLIILFLFSILTLNCSKEVETDTSINKYNPITHDSSFKEIVRLTLFDNELGLSLNDERITLKQFNEILSKLAIPEHSWTPNYTELSNFDQEDFFEYLDQNYSHTNLSIYFTKLLLHIKSFYYSNYEYLAELNEEERNVLFVDAQRKIIKEIEQKVLKVGPRSWECDWCKKEYAICKDNALIAAGAVVGAGYTTAASMAIYSGGTLTVPAAWTLFGGFIGGGFTYGAGYWACNNTLSGCLTKYKCSGAGGNDDPDDDHNTEKDYIININSFGRN